MKLSTAIRRGAKIRPQGFDELFSERLAEGKIQICSCALGAAWEAWRTSEGAPIRVSGPAPHWSEITNHWPELKQDVDLPNGWRADEVVSLASAVAWLNDEAQWTREQIADWLKEKGL